MFGRVWAWAGRYRVTETNIGILPVSIPATVRNLVRDASMWVTRADDRDLVAVRFHHRLVSIHPFPNGNGPHARLAADLFLEAMGSDPSPGGPTSQSTPAPSASAISAPCAGPIGTRSIWNRS